MKRGWCESAPEIVPLKHQIRMPQDHQTVQMQLHGLHHSPVSHLTQFIITQSELNRCLNLHNIYRLPQHTCTHIQTHHVSGHASSKL